MRIKTKDIVGRIQVIRDGNGLGLHQQWNPDQLTKAERETVANELEDIAYQMRNNRFEDLGHYELYEPKEQP